MPDVEATPTEKQIADQVHAELMSLAGTVASVSGWIKAFLGGAFVLGVWVANLTFSVNSHTQSLSEQSKSIQAIQAWKEEQNGTMATLLERVEYIRKDTAYLKEKWDERK